MAIDIYEERRIRAGKTAKDRKSGATARNYSNKRERAQWCQDSNATDGSFPRHTCNGKRNRSVIVIKKNGRKVK